MTKYEWESELKKGIHRLPDSEIKRVVEYYDELFYDKADRGKREADIIAEFGNPNDVAYKIIADYDGELKSENTVPPPVIKADQSTAKSEMSQYSGYGDYSRYGDYSGKHAEQVMPVNAAPTASAYTSSANQSVASPAPVKKVKSNGGRVVALVLFSVFLGWAFFAVAAILWAVLAAMVAAGGAFVVVGAGGAVMAIMAMTSSVGAGFAQLGMYIALVGFGLIFIVLFVKLIKLSAKATAGVFGSMKRFITVKKEGN